MKDISFFSNTKYIILPYKKKPRVFLALGKNKTKFNSFKLYNPFSSKAKFLKKIAFLFPFFNLSVKKKSPFIAYLEKRLETNLIVSIYVSTDKNKYVLQLQNEEGVYGYLKIGSSDLSRKQIINESYAISKLADLTNIKLLDKGKYKNYHYIILSEISGKSQEITSDNINYILNSLDRKRDYLFSDHPRIKNLFSELCILGQEEYVKIFLSINIDSRFKLVYEHGDFAPWNVISKFNTIHLIDFEYFVENGIEYFDLIKYYYQIYTLLYKYSNLQIVENILDKLDNKHNKEIFILFLLKEIVLKVNRGIDKSKEDDILKILLK